MLRRWKTSKELKKTFYRWSRLGSNVLSPEKMEKIAFSVEGQGEALMVWVIIEKEVSTPIPKLEVYADGFWMLSHLKNLLDDLKEWDQYIFGYENQRHMSPEDFESLLIKHGFKEIDYDH